MSQKHRAVLSDQLMKTFDDIHVIPMNDLHKHEESRDCWCQPIVKTTFGQEEPDWFPNEGDRQWWREQYGSRGLVVVHQAADGREFIEQHGLQ